MLQKNFVPLSESPRILVMKMSLTLCEYLPFALGFVATSRAPAPLAAGQAPAGAPPLVIDPAVGALTSFGASSVFFRPSTRTVTLVPFEPAPSAPDTGTAAQASTAAHTATTNLRFMRATPFLEGNRLCGRWLVSWLTGLPAAPSRCSCPHQWLGVAAGVPDHSGGSAPVSHRLPITTDLERHDRIAVGSPA